MPRSAMVLAYALPSIEWQPTQSTSRAVRFASQECRLKLVGRITALSGNIVSGHGPSQNETWRAFAGFCGFPPRSSEAGAITLR